MNLAAKNHPRAVVIDAGNFVALISPVGPDPVTGEKGPRRSPATVSITAHEEDVALGGPHDHMAYRLTIRLSSR